MPVVRDTGGLSDTIQAFISETGEGIGFKFADYSLSSLIDQIKSALELFKTREVWTRVVRNGMKVDFSWKRSAQEYLAVYKKALDYLPPP